jgi:NADPH2:quinone reductase
MIQLVYKRKNIMKAIIVKKFGGPDSMSFQEIQDLKEIPGYSLIDVKEVGINFADTHQIKNTYLMTSKTPFIPGAEAAGFDKDKKRVIGISPSGSYATKANLWKNLTLEIPDTLSFSQALHVFIQGASAWHLVNSIGKIKSREKVLVYSGGSGVGLIAIQLAKMIGAEVYSTSTKDSVIEIFNKMGVKTDIHNKKFDVILNMSGSDIVKDLAILNNFGRLVVYGMADEDFSNINLVDPKMLMNGSKTVSGFWLHNCFEEPSKFIDIVKSLFLLVQDGLIDTYTDFKYPLKDATKAHYDILSRKTYGKVILDVSID